MTAVARVMPKRPAAPRVVEPEACSPVTCKDCGIYSLCREVNGPDVDLRLLETIVRNRKIFKRGELLYRIGEDRKSVV